MEKRDDSKNGQVDVRADLAKFMKKAVAENRFPLPGQVRKAS